MSNMNEKRSLKITVFLTFMFVNIITAMDFVVTRADVDEIIKELPISMMADLIIDIADNFQAGCIYIVQPTYNSSDESLGESHARLLLLRLLSARGFPCGATPPYHVMRATRCYANAPLFVVMHESQDLREQQRELWSRPTVPWASVWLVFLWRRSLEELLDGVAPPVHGEFIVITPERTRNGVVTSLRLREAYRVAPYLPLRLYPYGRWPHAPTDAWPGLELYARRTDLSGLHLNVVAINNSVSSIIRDKDGKLVMTGIVADYWYTIQRMLNFTVTVLPAPDDAYGMLVREDAAGGGGQWNGAMGAVVNGTAEVAVEGLVMTPQRAAVVQFSAPFFINRYLLFMSTKGWITRRESYGPRWAGLLKPFRPALWVAVGATLLVSSAVLTLASTTRGAPIARAATSGDAFFYVFSALTLQGSEWQPRRASGRFAALAPSLAAVVLDASFAAALVSALALRRVQPPFRGLKGLLRSHSHRLIVTANGSEYDYFKLKKEPLEQGLFQRHLLPHSLDLPTDEVSAVRQLCDSNMRQRVVLLSGPVYLQNGYPARSPASKILMTTTLLKAHLRFSEYTLEALDSIGVHCRLAAVHVDVPSQPVGLAWHRGSPYKHILNYYLNAFLGSGSAKRLLRPGSWSTESALEQDSNTAKPDVALRDAAPLLALLAMGTTLALAILAMELLWNFRQLQSYQRRKKMPSVKEVAVVSDKVRYRMPARSPWERTAILPEFKLY